MVSRIRIGPEGGPYVIVDENNGVLDITTPNDEIDFGNNELVNAALGGVLDAKGNDITNVDALDSNSLSTATLVDRPDWVEDSDSPFELSGSPSVSASLADTGYDQYLLLLRVEGADRMRTSGVTASNAYDTLFNDDTRQGNSSALEFGTSDFAGEILVDTRLSSVRHEMRFNLVQGFAQTGLPVAGSNNDADDFTDFTFEDSGSETVSASVEVFHRGQS
ncbi:hypothetical protein [Halorubrum tailed virus BLv36]|nr:hypothetical protein [Halorubrum tailed virus BLv36]